MDKLKRVGARAFFWVYCLVILAFIVSGCASALRPNVTAGYAVFNYPNSNANCAIGSNGVQNNSIQRELPEAAINGETEVKDGQGKESKTTSGLFVNAGNFDKRSETDLSAAVEALRNVKGTAAGQTQTSSGSTGTSTQSPEISASETKSTQVEVPVAVSQAASSANTGGIATRPEGQAAQQQQQQEGGGSAGK